MKETDYQWCGDDTGRLGTKHNNDTQPGDALVFMVIDPAALCVGGNKLKHQGRGCTGNSSLKCWQHIRHPTTFTCVQLHPVGLLPYSIGNAPSPPPHREVISVWFMTNGPETLFSIIAFVAFVWVGWLIMSVFDWQSIYQFVFRGKNAHFLPQCKLQAIYTRATKPGGVHWTRCPRLIFFCREHASRNQLRSSRCWTGKFPSSMNKPAQVMGPWTKCFPLWNGTICWLTLSL